MSVKRIENNTDRFIHLPALVAVESDDQPPVDYHEGIRLSPGLNTVPARYLAALREEKLPVHDVLGRPKVTRTGEPVYRYPGREAMEQLLRPVNHTTARGRVFGPQITVYEDEQVGREDGPTPPATLPSKTEAALALVAVCDHRPSLENWLRQTKDGSVKIAIQTRLQGLGK